MNTFEEDLLNKSPSLLNYNPVYKKEPVLVQNGRPVSESDVILEYVDETRRDGPCILPEDPYERSRVRFWSKFIDQQLIGGAIGMLRASGESKSASITSEWRRPP